VRNKRRAKGAARRTASAIDDEQHLVAALELVSRSVTRSNAANAQKRSCVNLFDGGTVATNGQWIEITAKPVKVSNSQSLFVSPSLVSGLYTRTRTKTADGSTSQPRRWRSLSACAVLTPADGSADIVAPPLDLRNASVWGCGNQANGWGVVLESRIQTQWQTISECTVLVDGAAGTEVAAAVSWTARRSLRARMPPR
jgi:hypothetical protein